MDKYVTNKPSSELSYALASHYEVITIFTGRLVYYGTCFGHTCIFENMCDQIVMFLICLRLLFPYITYLM
jgi:hypothetical protein